MIILALSKIGPRRATQRQPVRTRIGALGATQEPASPSVAQSHYFGATIPKRYGRAGDYQLGRGIGSVVIRGGQSKHIR